MVKAEEKKVVEKIIQIILTHTEHNGGYCDTGEDMEWSCRSDCVRLAIERINKEFGL